MEAIDKRESWNKGKLCRSIARKCVATYQNEIRASTWSGVTPSLLDAMPGRNRSEGRGISDPGCPSLELTVVRRPNADPGRDVLPADRRFLRSPLPRRIGILRG